MAERRPGPGRPDQRLGRIPSTNRPQAGTPIVPDELQVRTQAVVVPPVEAGGTGSGWRLGARLRAASGAFLARDALVLGAAELVAAELVAAELVAADLGAAELVAATSTRDAS